MGLGKSLQVVSIIHTLLTHPILVYKTQNLNCQSSRIIQRILLVVPVNTLENWKNEFHKWLIDIPKIFLYDFSSSGKGGRRFLSERWVETGGVMLITSDTFARSIKSDTGESILNRKIFQSPGPDVVIIDEGHMMLKNKNTEISKTLFSMKTSRRIVLTGTPLQNNLMELYQMAHWIRPGCLGAESDFEKNFVSTIMSSLTVSTNQVSCNIKSYGVSNLSRLT
jgi:SNF2 family DNA or RNA helicase